MLGILWLLGSVLAAFALLVARFGTSFTLAEHIAISIPVGIVVPAWLVYLIACLTSALGTHTLAGSTALICYLLYENFDKFWKTVPKVLKSAAGAGERIDSAIAALIVAVSSIFLVPLYGTRMIPEEDGKIWSGGSCWADLPIHMTIAESFLSGRNQDVSWGGLHSPVFAGEKLAYPFMPDFHAAVMVRLGGCSLRTAFLLPGLALCFALLVLMYLFTVRVTRSRLGGLLSILLLLGAGGMGGWNLAARDGFWNATQKDTAQNDAVGSDGRIVWFAFLPHVLLPQRGANFAYPLNLAVLLLVWRAGDVMDKGITYEMRKTMLLVAGSLAGLLPLVQAHSFVALACLIGAIAVLDFHKWMADPRLLVAWAQAGILAAVEAYPQFRIFQHQVESGAAGHFIKTGWWYRNHEVGQVGGGGLRGFLNFWWMNTGPALGLFIAVMLLQFVEVAYALVYAEVLRSHAGGSPSSVHAGTGAVAVASGGPVDVLDDLYRKEQPSPIWASVTNRAAARAAAGITGGAATEPEPASSSVRGRRLQAHRPPDSDDEDDEWTVEKTEDEDEGDVRRPTTPQMLAMTAAANGLGRVNGSGSVELRIAHLEMEYTLPGVAVASDGDKSDPPRFKLELPASSSPTVIVSHVGGGKPDLGMASLAAMSGGATGAGAGAHPGEGSGAGTPPRGARVARAFDKTYELKDAKKAPHFSAHVWAYVKAQLAQALGVHVDDLFDPSRYAISAVDRSLWTANRLSLSGRAWDTLKLGIGATAIFLLGNFVNFQPWDRDNCKLFYVWIMINAMLAGSLLAAPVEYFLGMGPGAARVASWLPLNGSATYGRALFLAQGQAAPLALLPVEHRLGTPVAGSASSKTSAAASADPSAKVKGSTTGSGSAASWAALGQHAPVQMLTARAVSTALLLAGPWLIAKATLTGFMMIYREFGLYHVLLDEEQRATGQWIKDNVAPKAVMVHKDTHITPSGCLAGRPTLVAYTGWMWSHGYNYGDRDRDRNYIMENSLKDSDGEAYNRLRRWGVRYVIGEHMPRHGRNEGAPGYHPDMYLDGQLKRVYSNGRFDVLEVMGYGFPPN